MRSYYFDGTGKPLGDGGLETGTVGQQILGALQPLHFGWFGGLVVKIAYGLLGFALTVVTHSGIAIWLARRREQGRPLPLWEKIWSAVTWGQPLAIAAAALTIFVIGEAYAVPIYAAVTALAISSAPLAPDAVRLTHLLRVLAGLTILAAVGLHALTWYGRATDPVHYWVSAALAIAGLCVLASAVRRSAPHLSRA